MAVLTAAAEIAPDVPAAEAAALLARMESVPFSRWHVRARLVMGSATFFDAFDALSMAFVLPVLIGPWSISPAEVGFLISSSYLGQVIGALIFSRLAETRGRVPMAAAATALMSLMSVACAFAGSFSALFACRFVQGIGVGGEMPVAAAYVSELSPASRRGRFFMLYEMIFPVGLMMTGQIGAWAVPHLGWQAMFLIGGIPGLAVSLLLRGLPESPRWLIARGRLAEAEAVIRELEKSTDRRLPPAQGSDAGRDASRPRPTRWSEVVAPQFRGRTLVVWTLWFCTYFIANGMNNWMPTLYQTVYGLELAQSLRTAALTNVAQVALLLVCAFCIDRIGRKQWILMTFIGGGALLAALGAGGAGEVAWVVILATLAYGLIGSSNAVLYLYTPEIYPTRMRAVATGLATSWLRIASAIAPASIGFMIAHAGVAAVFNLFVIVAIIGAVASLRMIETRGRRLEDIAA
jgi:MFS transporter, putative metabolite:H+ symporter